MPRGTRHTLSGTLRWNGRCYILEIDNGGYWLLDTSKSYRRLVDYKVTVEGTRSGFNLLDVRSLVADGSVSMPQGIGAFLRSILRFKNERFWTNRLD